VSSSQKLDINKIGRLVEASQAGDRSAFDELVRLYQQRAMRVAVGILGSANDGAEAVQNGFVKAFLKIDKLRQIKRFEGWLLKIVANSAINQQRTRKHRAKDITITDCCEDRNSVQPIQKEISEELKEAIGKAMLQLTKKEAKAISLFGLQDLPHKEVADIMGCSAGAAKWYVFRARQKLKVLLKEYLQ